MVAGQKFRVFSEIELRVGFKAKWEDRNLRGMLGCGDAIPRKDVVRDGGYTVLVAEFEAQGKHQGSLARPHRSIY